MKFDDTKILISDDSILARKQLKDILSQFGTPTFLEAANGQDAIDIYKKESPSLVFLDIVMPIKDGNAVIHEITDFDPDATIIIVSSVGTQSQLPAQRFIAVAKQAAVRFWRSKQRIIIFINRKFHFL